MDEGSAMFRVIISLLVLQMLSSSAFASYVCAGKVQGLTIQPKNGQIMAEKVAGITWPILCNVNQEHNGISTASCKHMYSLLLAAQLSKADVQLWFNDEAQGGSCQSHPAWETLTGWYFGPMLK